VVGDALELKIRLEPGDGEAYRVHASGPTGEASGTFRLPFDARDIELFVLRVSSRTRTDTRRAEPHEIGLITDFGGTLFESLFQAELGALYRVAKNVADREDRSLRVTLVLTDVPELMHLPWEYLYDEPAFLSISEWTPVVRYLEMQGGRRPLRVELPLRILAMVSAPEDAPPLDAVRERERLEEALNGLIERGAVEITWLENATLQALLRTLQTGPFHIFHYIGHGVYEPERDGFLLLEDNQRRARRVSGTDLGTILAGHRTLRLAVLNTCEGARVSSDDPFAGVAASLIRREIPAVIAMQFEITDCAAITFSGEFYWKLADCGMVDSALAFARQMIYAAPNYVEWATPVLFMRVPDGRIFEVPDAAVDRPPPALTEPALTEPVLTTPAGTPPAATEPAPTEPAPTEPTVTEPAATAPSTVASGTRRPRFGRRATVVTGAGIAAAAGLALAIWLIASPGPETSPTRPTTISGTSTVSHPWTLRGAIPAAVGSCRTREELLYVPGALVAKVDAAGNTARFSASFACWGAAQGVTVAQYSRAASADDLDRYFNSRVNAQGFPARELTGGLCGGAEPANNNWTPLGPTGHRPTNAATGAGRVFCYKLSRPGSRSEWRIEWTVTRRRIFAFAKGPNAATLFRWWKTKSGPIVTAR
jgi:hypothetical protein